MEPISESACLHRLIAQECNSHRMLSDLDLELPTDQQEKSVRLLTAIFAHHKSEIQFRDDVIQNLQQSLLTLKRPQKLCTEPNVDPNSDEKISGQSLQSGDLNQSKTLTLTEAQIQEFRQIQKLILKHTSTPADSEPLSERLQTIFDDHQKQVRDLLEEQQKIRLALDEQIQNFDQQQTALKEQIKEKESSFRFQMEELSAKQRDSELHIQSQTQRLQAQIQQGLQKVSSNENQIQRLKTEIEDANHKSLNLETELAKTKRENADYSKQLQQIEHRHQQLLQKKSNWELSNREKETQQRLRKELEELLEEKLRSLEVDFEAKQQSSEGGIVQLLMRLIAYFESQIEIGKKLLEESTKILAQKEELIAALKAANGNLKSEIENKAKADAVFKEMLQVTAQKYREQLKLLKDQKIEADRDRQQTELLVKGAQEEREQLKSQLADRESQLSKALQDHKQQSESFQEKQNELNRSLEAAQKQNQELTSEIGSLRSQKRVLEASMATSGELSATSQLNGQLNAENLKMSDEILNLKKQLKESNDTKTELKNILKTAQNERKETLENWRSQERKTKELEEHLAQLKNMSQKGADLTENKAHVEQNQRISENEVEDYRRIRQYILEWMDDGSEHSLMLPSLKSLLTANKQEAESANSQIKEMETTQNQLKQSLKEVNSQLQRSLQEIQRKEQECKVLSQERDHSNSQLEQLLKESAAQKDAEKQHSAQKVELEKASEKVSHLESQILQLKQQWAEKERQMQQADKAASQAEARLEEILRTHKNDSELRQSDERNIFSLQEELIKEREKIKELRQQIVKNDQLQIKNRHLEEMVDSLNKTNERLQKKEREQFEESQSARVKELKRQIDQLQALLGSKTQDQQELQKTISKNQEELQKYQQLSKELQKLKEQKKDFEDQLKDKEQLSAKINNNIEKIQRLKEECQNQTTTRNVIQKEKAKLSEDLEQRGTEIERLKADLENKSKSMDAEEQKVKEAQEKLEATNNVLKKQGSLIEHLRATIEGLKENLEKVGQTAEMTKSFMEKQSEELEKSEQQLEAIKGEASAKDNQKREQGSQHGAERGDDQSQCSVKYADNLTLQQILGTLPDQSQQLKEGRGSHGELLSYRNQKLLQMMRTLEEQESKIRQLLSQCEKKGEEISALDSRIHSLTEKEQAACRQIQALRGESQAFKQEIQTLKEQNQQIQALESQLQKDGRSKAQLQANFAELEAENAKIKAQNAELQNGLCELEDRERSLIKQKEELETKIPGLERENRDLKVEIEKGRKKRSEHDSVVNAHIRVVQERLEKEYEEGIQNLLKDFQRQREKWEGEKRKLSKVTQHFKSSALRLFEAVSRLSSALGKESRLSELSWKPGSEEQVKQWLQKAEDLAELLETERSRQNLCEQKKESKDSFVEKKLIEQEQTPSVLKLRQRYEALLHKERT